MLSARNKLQRRQTAAFHVYYRPTKPTKRLHSLQSRFAFIIPPKWGSPALVSCYICIFTIPNDASFSLALFHRCTLDTAPMDYLQMHKVGLPCTMNGLGQFLIIFAVSDFGSFTSPRPQIQPLKVGPGCILLFATIHFVAFDTVT